MNFVYAWRVGERFEIECNTNVNKRRDPNQGGFYTEYLQTFNFEYDLVDWRGGVSTVRLEPMYEFQMRGLGYTHPEFGHAVWKGEAVVGGDRMTLPVGTPCAREHAHIQALCKATFFGADGHEEHGTGILEQLAIGDHHTGLTGILDPYSPAS
jgi:hypothetical protein